ncbi:MAG: cell division cycle 123 family protein [Victivallaceae bacterium]|nr:cell division cycle 123 family protein [Victivallaceae bacterium]
MTIDEFCRMPVWYEALSEYAFPTRFVPVPEELARLIASGDAEAVAASPLADAMISELKKVLAGVPGNCFASIDGCAPTDTERYAGKRGATYSAKSTFFNLASSAKVRAAAAAGAMKNICIRPFRRMSWPREFRLFIRDGKLSAMSQYHLVRHFRRLEGYRDRYWQMAADFAEMISDRLPAGNIVADIYFTSGWEILLIDFNVWGPPTDPLMLLDWDRDWSEPAGICLMAEPYRLQGDVNVSF